MKNILMVLNANLPSSSSTLLFKHSVKAFSHILSPQKRILFSLFNNPLDFPIIWKTVTETDAVIISLKSPQSIFIITVLIISCAVFKPGLYTVFSL